ncbi:MAG: NTP transferase domain-containing protein [Ignavibacteriae bacterium]|nr:NTP transferase domain-containing protein [Ignavibacteria bacterium]MBI3364310.1 NTP transferase domain-containing protein [Ignavibacteriota bacterium]
MSIELIKPPRSLAVVIMAAGKGTRMKNPDLAKVMYDINGKPMVWYVVELATKLQAERIMLIVGWQKQPVIDYVSQAYPNVEFAEQAQQLGTGHAVMQAMTALKEFEGDLLVLSGDVPLLTEKTARAHIGYHRATDAAATILTAELKDPGDYGRIARSDDGSVQKIVEHKDASKKELAIREINSGIYVFDKQKLFECLLQLQPNNAQGEYYLTDVFELFWKNKWRVSAVKVLDPVEVMGINDLQQLESARATIAARTTT